MSASQGRTLIKFTWPMKLFDVSIFQPVAQGALLSYQIIGNKFGRISLNQIKETNDFGEWILNCKKRIKIYLKFAQILLPSRPYQALRREENNDSSPLLTCSIHACPIVQSPKQLQGEDSSADFAWKNSGS